MVVKHMPGMKKIKSTLLFESPGKDRNKENYLRDEADLQGRNAMEYLSRLTLFLNDYCPQDCTICSGAFKQFPCCTAIPNRYFSRELEISKLKTVFAQLHESNLSDLVFLGGNILDYSHLEALLDLVEPLPATTTFYLHYLNVLTHPGRIGLLEEIDGNIKIPVTFPVQLTEFEAAMQAVHDSHFNAQIVYIIQTVEDFEAAQALTALFDIASPCFQPYYNGSNHRFFEDYVYYDSGDIAHSKPSVKEIYARGYINTFNFGSLTIAANGKIYPQINAPALGEMGTDPLRDCIDKELSNDETWKKVRKHVAPCKDCTYKRLCPPISQYSEAIGKYNLCHIPVETSDTDSHKSIQNIVQLDKTNLSLV